MKKRILSALLVIVMLIGVLPICAAAMQSSAPTTAQQHALDFMFVQGTNMKQWLTSNPGMGYIYVDENSRTMVPLRAVIETLGLDVAWNGKDGSITINGGQNGQVIFFVGSKEYTIAGKQYTMDTIPVVIEGRTHIPVRFAAESVGGEAYYTGGVGAKFAEIYDHANDVKPYAPSWVDGDYVTFDRTSVYTPENWALLTALRTGAEKGEDVTAELQAFIERFYLSQTKGIQWNWYYDEGVNYEVMLIATQLKQNGYKISLPGYLMKVYYKSADELTQEQSDSATRWKLRMLAAGETKMTNDFKRAYYSIICPQFSGTLVSGATYDSYDLRRLELFGESANAFLQEKWFAKLADKTAPAAIFFDGDCFSPDMTPTAIIKDAGTVMIDMDLIGSSMGLMKTSPHYTLLLPGLTWDDRIVDKESGVFTYIGTWRGETLTITTGSAYVTLGEKRISMGKAAQRNVNRAYVPLSFLTDVLGVDVEYNQKQSLYFVSTSQVSSDRKLVKWTLGMSAILAERNDGNPYYFGIYNRCNRTQDADVAAGHAYYPAYYLSNNILADSWGCTDGDGVKQQVGYLLESVSTQHPAWDLFRVAHLASWGYSAGYLTAEESLRLIRPAAEKLKISYTNWEDATMDYLDGFLDWGGSQEEYRLRLEIYERLKAEQNVFGVLFDDALFSRPVV